MKTTRRSFLQTSAAGLTALGLGAHSILGQKPTPKPGERPKQDAKVKVLNPRNRVPVSIIIDDSTCLVNLNRFAIPQFEAAFGGTNRYSKYNWRKMPHEIPDSFVRKFADWSRENGVKGKYSIVPFPACVGRLDRILPGWTVKEMAASIKLVQDHIMPNWDIHPEMITHTRVIDLKTGHPYPERSERYMENWRWTDNRSVAEIADYMRYALTILKNVDLPCEGLTTPGGFGNRVLPELSQATLHSCRDVFKAEIPHYFRHLLASGDGSVAPRVEYASGLKTKDPKCVVSIYGCTGDWTGGWDCGNRGDLERFITKDLAKGRMVDVIERGEPACIVCHWTGVYFNGEEVGFKIFQEVVKRLHQKYDHLIWMTLSEISRYWAAKELTEIMTNDSGVSLNAPFACPGFTVRVPGAGKKPPRVQVGNKVVSLKEVKGGLQLKAGTFWREKNDVVVCFDLPKGSSVVKA